MLHVRLQRKRLYLNRPPSRTIGWLSILSDSNGGEDVFKVKYVLKEKEFPVSPK